MGNALDDPFGNVHIEPACGVIIQKQKRFSTDHEHVVDAHGHQILTDAIVATVVDGQLQLGAYAIGTGHQDRGVVTGRKFRHGGKAAQTAQHFRSSRGLGRRCDALYQFRARFDVHARVLIGQAGAAA